MRSTLWIEVFEDDTTSVIACCGELDISTAPALEVRVRAAALADFERVLVDLRHVSFMDLAGLRALVRASATARAEGVGLRILNATPAARRVLDLTQLDELAACPAFA